MVRFINCTQQTIHMTNGRVIKPSGIEINVERHVSNFNEEGIREEWVRSICGLPPKQDNTVYIVARIVMMSCPERDDLVTPVLGYRAAYGDRMRKVTGFFKYRMSYPTNGE